MKRANRGFTLIELMIAVAIIGILVAIAYPAYTSQVAKSRRADAKGALSAFANAMERYYTENFKYTAAAAGGADTGAPAIFPTEAPLDGATKYYDLRIQQAGGTTYILRATPKGAQAGDGYLELTSTGVRRWDRNNQNGIEAGENSWD